MEVDSTAGNENDKGSSANREGKKKGKKKGRKGKREEGETVVQVWSGVDRAAALQCEAAITAGAGLALGIRCDTVYSTTTIHIYMLYVTHISIYLTQTQTQPTSPY